MPLNKDKHIVEEINGIRCTVVETGIDEARMLFLKELLELNHYDVQVAKSVDKQGNETGYVVAVTDLLFNPVVDVYKRRLHSKSGKKVTPAYWLQLSDAETEAEVNYWDFKK